MTISELALAAKKVIEAAWLHGEPYDLASQAAFALESAQLLQSPHTADELDVLRRSVESNRVDGQRLIRAEQRRAELEAVIAVHRNDDQARIERLQSRVDEVERKYAFDTAELRRENDALRKQVAELEALNRQMGRRGMKVYAQAVEAGRRVRELEAERQTVNEVLDDVAQTLRGRALIEDPHDGPLSHRYAVGRDLPQAGGAS